MFDGSNFGTGETRFNLRHIAEIDLSLNNIIFHGVLIIECATKFEGKAFKYQKLINLSFIACKFMQSIILSGYVDRVPDL